MFKSTHPNHIDSDEGFSVQVLQGGRDGIIYREGSHQIKVLSDSAIKPYGYIIYRNSIKKWAPPENGDLIEEPVRERIIHNLCRAFLFQGYQIRIDDIETFRDSLLDKLQRIE